MIQFSPVYFTHFIVVALFTMGLIGFLTRKNAIVVLMCLELMLNSVNLFLIETSMRMGNSEGIILVVFSITIAAAEVAVGLGIILNLYRQKKTVDLELFKELRG